VKVYGIRNCASVKKAKEFLDSHNIDYEFVDINKNKIDSEKLDFWQI
jgi:arsenate reductase